MAYYKAFKKGMICNGKQYAENADFEEQGADKCCTAGVMHFCKEPMDVLNYYPLVDENGDFSEFATVKPLEKVIEKGDKCASKKIHIGAKLGLKGFIEAAVDVLIEKTKGKGESGNCAQIKMDGARSVAACIGNNGAIKGKNGCWIVLAEWKYIDDKYTPVCVKAAQIDGKTLKEDAFYRLENGEFVEVEG